RVRHHSSGAWMELPMHGTKILAVYMSVDLRRGDVCVAEHLLNGPEVGAALQQMRGEAVSQRVRSDVSRDPCRCDVPLQDLPCTHPAQRRASRVQEEPALALAALQLRTCLTKVHRRRTQCAPANRYQPLLAALSENPEQALVHEDVGSAKPDPLRYAKPGPIPQLHHCPIAERERLFQCGSREKCLHLGDAQHLRKRTPASRCGEAVTRIAA